MNMKMIDSMGVMARLRHITKKNIYADIDPKNCYDAMLRTRCGSSMVSLIQLSKPAGPVIPIRQSF